MFLDVCKISIDTKEDRREIGGRRDAILFLRSLFFSFISDTVSYHIVSYYTHISRFYPTFPREVQDP
jgi:hypothetical protein